MAEEKEKKTKAVESKVIEGFKFGFGVYIAFLTGTVIVGLLTSLIWWLILIR